ncbi:membrane anchoring protein efr3a [Lobosporangium transversale]|uniref:Armadillo-type protein n=1 Tax=Lobosporangium transversale TaxID=64571 RepID=A0A1Y2GPF4_9FUNG|nr:hypothetical protein BCR41DRAFT_395860 [Lobosporangium transversale]KAF9910682.1 membrane anchoring protein efr3a [Lobosporangium transversale]ORZ17580.1 hypothetical protein BCR41DRAFT_395860 [Lobosporangium transversale]|eukprot:XP_021881967.1 hypothetical protein BCR41DRAFT_395860 [Lobosporangium transversale]
MTTSSSASVLSITPTPPTPRSRSASVSASSIHGLSLNANGSVPPVPPVPHPNATHSSLIPSRYVKHASLINNCYPAKSDEKGPKSSELSYLVFYTTSKPVKLTKVGSFIENKVVRDYRKKRLNDVHCSLEIIKALLIASKGHLNIFSKNIVAILDTLLVDTSDFDIVRHCQIVFSAFCAAHDGSTLGVDQDFRTLYERVVARFSDIATLQGDENNKYRLVGLKALESVVSSAALHAYDHKSQLNLVLPSIIDCLIDAKDGIQISLEDSSSAPASPRPSTSTRAPTHVEKDVAEDEVTAHALQCLRALFKTQNGDNVRQALEPTFSYLDEYGVWWPSSITVGIIKAIMNPIMPQFRYMVVNEVIARIDSVDSTTPEMSLRLQKKVTLISALEAILYSPLTLVGMPVLEVLNSLLTALSKSLSVSTSLSKEGESSQLLVLETLIQDGLTRSVGGLATHIYYSNQIPHIISHIVSKLSHKIGIAPQPDTIDGVPTTEYRKAQLKCLTSVIKTSKEHGRHESGLHVAEISSELLTPCLGLLLDENVGVRTAFAQALITFLATEDEGHSQESLLATPAPAVSSDLYFRAATHQTLHAYARLPTATPTDMAAIYGILRALFAHFQDDEFMRVVPVLFSLQDWSLQEDAEDGSGHEQDPTILVARKRAIATVIVIYLQKAVSSYGMAEPLEYLENIQKSREGESQWYPIYYENQESLTRTIGHQWEAPSEPLSPVLTHPLAREHLITLLTTVSDRFRSGADRFSFAYNPETQSNLLSAQSAKEGNNSILFSSMNIAGNQSLLGPKGEGRIRVSRLLEDWALPKIVMPPSTQANGLLSTDESAEGSVQSTQISRRTSFFKDNLNEEANQSHKTIGVENLKQALSAAHQAADGGDTNSSVAGSESHGPSPALQRFYMHSGQRSKHHQSSINGGSSLSISSNLATSRPELADLLNSIQVTVPTKDSSLSLVIPPY